MVWNAVKSERFPAAIMHVESEVDVCEAIRFARQHDLKVAIRGGGHNWHNSALRQGGIMLDLSGLNELQVNAQHRTAAVQPGVKGPALMANLAPHGLAFPIAHDGADVALSGYLLNGGLGWNYSVWGPACASIEALDIVNAHGELIRADERQNADLFWAARGAGPGFFGVVTRFHLRVQPLPKAMLRSTLTYPIEAIDKVAAWLPLLARSVPANVNWRCLALGARDGTGARLVILAVAFADSDSDARDALGAFGAEPAGLTAIWKDLYRAVSVENVFGRADAVVPDSPRYLGDELWSNASPQELLTSMRSGLLATQSTGSFVMLWFSHRKGWLQQPDMAFSRSGSTLVGVYGIWSDAAEDSEKQAWVRTTIASVDPLKVGHYAGTSDLTFAPDRAKQCFSPSAWDKLGQLKRKYDPDDVFFSYLR